MFLYSLMKIYEQLRTFRNAFYSFCYFYISKSKFSKKVFNLENIGMKWVLYLLNIIRTTNICIEPQYFLVVFVLHFFRPELGDEEPDVFTLPLPQLFATKVRKYKLLFIYYFSWKIIYLLNILHRYLSRQFLNYKCKLVFISHYC